MHDVHDRLDDLTRRVAALEEMAELFRNAARLAVISWEMGYTDATKATDVHDPATP